MNTLEVTTIEDYLATINYKASQETLEKLSYVVGLTKTRKQETEYDGPRAGDEHILLMHALCETFNITKMFEIGTGRGTSCYMSSIVESVNTIDTVDIRPFDEICSWAIKNVAVRASMKDLHESIKLSDKSKVNFYHTSQVPDLFNYVSASGDFYDLAHIDGNHSDYEVVLQDFKICYNMLRPGGIIVFDDYDPTRFIVKKVVDDIIENIPGLNPKLIVHRGRIFGKEPDGSDATPHEASSGIGVVIITKPSPTKPEGVNK